MARARAIQWFVWLSLMTTQCSLLEANLVRAQASPLTVTMLEPRKSVTLSWYHSIRWFSAYFGPKSCHCYWNSTLTRVTVAGRPVTEVQKNCPWINKNYSGESGYQPIYEDTYDDTYFLDLTTEQYTAGPKLQVPRFRHSCHYIKATNEIIIVGGQLEYLNATCENEVYKSVEIIDLDTNTIRYGKQSQCCHLAKFKPFLSLDCSGCRDTIQGKEVIKFCSLV